MSIKLDVRIGTNNIKTVYVNPDDQLNVLMGKLGITDKKTMFLQNGISHCIGSIETFREIELVREGRIFLTNQALATSLLDAVII
jgi:hypothetical protein